MLFLSNAWADTAWECDTVALPEDAWAYNEATPADNYDDLDAELSAWSDSSCTAVTCAYTRTTTVSCDEVDCVTSAGATWYSYREEFTDGEFTAIKEVTPPASAGLDWTWARIEAVYDNSLYVWYEYDYSAEWSGTPFAGWPADDSFTIHLWSYDDGTVAEEETTWQTAACTFTAAWGTTGEWEEWNVDVNSDPRIAVHQEYYECTFGGATTATVGGVFEGAVEPVGWAADPDDMDRDGYLASTGDCDDTDPTTHPCAAETPSDGIDSDCSGLDADGDGALSVSDGGDDCDDTDSTAYVGAVDVPYDGIDQDCDGADLTDADGDGDDDESEGGTDCDDTDPTIHRGAPEVEFDGIDQDCDGRDDADADGDHQDTTAVGGLDCDDTDPTIRAYGTEVPYDGIDQDCDGVDLTDVDGDGYDATEAGGDDCDDSDATVNPGETEYIHDEIDQDCSGGDADDIDGDGGAAEAAGDGEDACGGDDSGAGCSGRAWLVVALPLVLFRGRPRRLPRGHSSRVAATAAAPCTSPPAGRSRTA